MKAKNNDVEGKIEQQTTTKSNKKMQSRKGEGGVGIPLRGNSVRYVEKVEHRAERITTMHIKTQMHGKCSL